LSQQISLFYRSQRLHGIQIVGTLMAALGVVVVAVTNYVYFNPVTTVLFAWLILSERITIYFIIGTVLILVGMYLSNKSRKGASEKEK
jgi:drug/metabolite transporter (DMT)-like permease